MSQKLGNRNPPSCSYFKCIWGWGSDFGKLELLKLEDQIYS